MDNAYRCQAGDLSERARLAETNKGDQLQLSLSGLCGNEGQAWSDPAIKRKKKAQQTGKEAIGSQSWYHHLLTV